MPQGSSASSHSALTHSADFPLRAEEREQRVTKSRFVNSSSRKSRGHRGDGHLSIALHQADIDLECASAMEARVDLEGVLQHAGRWAPVIWIWLRAISNYLPLHAFVAGKG